MSGRNYTVTLIGLYNKLIIAVNVTIKLTDFVNKHKNEFLFVNF